MLIIKNRSASFNYQLEKSIEAGLSLEGWEIKSIREGKVNIAESHIFIKNDEVFVSNLTITPLITANNHQNREAVRVRKLLLNRHEINKMIGSMNQKGLTCVPLNLHWSNGKVKMDIALAKGKKLHDKRQSLKDKDIARESQRAFKIS